MPVKHIGHRTARARTPSPQTICVQTESSFYPPECNFNDRWQQLESQGWTNLKRVRDHTKRLMSGLCGNIQDLLAWKDVVYEIPMLSDGVPLADLTLLTSKLYRKTSELAYTVAAFFDMVFSEDFVDDHFHFVELRVTQRELSKIVTELDVKQRENAKLREELEIMQHRTQEQAKEVHKLEDNNTVLETRSASLEEQMALLFEQLADDFIFFNEDQISRVTGEMKSQENLSQIRSAFSQSIEVVQHRLQYFQQLINEVREDKMISHLFDGDRDSGKGKLKALQVHLSHISARFNNIREGLLATATDLHTALADKKKVINFSVQHLKAYELQNHKLRTTRSKLYDLRQELNTLKRIYERTLMGSGKVEIDQRGHIVVENESTGLATSTADMKKRFDKLQDVAYNLTEVLGLQDEHRELMKTISMSIPSSPRGKGSRQQRKQNIKEVGDVLTRSAAGGGGSSTTGSQYPSIPNTAVQHQTMAGISYPGAPVGTVQVMQPHPGLPPTFGAYEAYPITPQLAGEAGTVGSSIGSRSHHTSLGASQSQSDVYALQPDDVVVLPDEAIKAGTGQVVVTNLPPHITEQELAGHLQAYGKVLEVDLVREEHSGTAAYSYVTFEQNVGAHRAAIYCRHIGDREVVVAVVYKEQDREGRGTAEEKVTRVSRSGGGPPGSNFSSGTMEESALSSLPDSVYTQYQQSHSPSSGKAAAAGGGKLSGSGKNKKRVQVDINANQFVEGRRDSEYTDDDQNLPIVYATSSTPTPGMRPEQPVNLIVAPQPNQKGKLQEELSEIQLQQKELAAQENVLRMLQEQLEEFESQDTAGHPAAERKVDVAGLMTSEDQHQLNKVRKSLAIQSQQHKTVQSHMEAKLQEIYTTTEQLKREQTEMVSAEHEEVEQALNDLHHKEIQLQKKLFLLHEDEDTDGFTESSANKIETVEQALQEVQAGQVELLKHRQRLVVLMQQQLSVSTAKDHVEKVEQQIHKHEKQKEDLTQQLKDIDDSAANSMKEPSMVERKVLEEKRDSIIEQINEVESKTAHMKKLTGTINQLLATEELAKQLKTEIQSLQTTLDLPSESSKVDEQTLSTLLGAVKDQRKKLDKRAWNLQVHINNATLTAQGIDVPHSSQTSTSIEPSTSFKVSARADKQLKPTSHTEKAAATVMSSSTSTTGLRAMTTVATGAKSDMGTPPLVDSATGISVGLGGEGSHSRDSLSSPPTGLTVDTRQPSPVSFDNEFVDLFSWINPLPPPMPDPSLPPSGIPRRPHRSGRQSEATGGKDDVLGESNDTLSSGNQWEVPNADQQEQFWSLADVQQRRKTMVMSVENQDSMVHWYWNLNMDARGPKRLVPFSSEINKSLEQALLQKGTAATLYLSDGSEITLVDMSHRFPDGSMHRIHRVVSDPNPHKVLISGIDEHVTEETVQTSLKEFSGTVKSVRVCRDTKGYSLCMAIVCLGSASEATDVVKYLKSVDGVPVTTELLEVKPVSAEGTSISKQDRLNLIRHSSTSEFSSYTMSSNGSGTTQGHNGGGSEPVRVVVTNLSTRTAEDKLTSILASYGQLIAVNVARDAFTGRSMGYAFAWFRTRESARNAMAKCHKIDGRPVVLGLASSSPQKGAMTHMGALQKRQHNRNGGGSGGSGGGTPNLTPKGAWKDNLVYQGTHGEISRRGGGTTQHTIAANNQFNGTELGHGAELHFEDEFGQAQAIDSGAMSPDSSSSRHSKTCPKCGTHIFVTELPSNIDPESRETMDKLLKDAVDRIKHEYATKLAFLKQVYESRLRMLEAKTAALKKRIQELEKGRPQTDEGVTARRKWEAKRQNIVDDERKKRELQLASLHRLYGSMISNTNNNNQDGGLAEWFDGDAQTATDRESVAESIGSRNTETLSAVVHPYAGPHLRTEVERAKHTEEASQIREMGTRIADKSQTAVDLYSQAALMEKRRKSPSVRKEKAKPSPSEDTARRKSSAK